RQRTRCPEMPQTRAETSECRDWLRRRRAKVENRDPTRSAVHNKHVALVVSGKRYRTSDGTRESGVRECGTARQRIQRYIPLRWGEVHTRKQLSPAALVGCDPPARQRIVERWRKCTLKQPVVIALGNHRG